MLSIELYIYIHTYILMILYTCAMRSCNICLSFFHNVFFVDIHTILYSNRPVSVVMTSAMRRLVPLLPFGDEKQLRVPC